jgi:hypothetical protein
MRSLLTARVWLAIADATSQKPQDSSNSTTHRTDTYKTPDDMLQSVRVNWGRSVVQADYAEQIRHMASQLLLELKDVNSRRRPAFFA